MEQQLTIPRYEIDIFWSDEDDAFIAVVPDLPYCSAWGDTYQEALDQVQTAIKGHIKVAEKYGDVIPETRAYREVGEAATVQHTESVEQQNTEDLSQSVDLYSATLQHFDAQQQRYLQDMAQQVAKSYADFFNSMLYFSQETLLTGLQVAQNSIQVASQATQQGMQAAGQAAQQGVEAASQAAFQSAQTANQTAQQNQEVANQAAQEGAEIARRTGRRSSS